MSISENTVEQQLTKAARHCARSLFDQPIAERHATLFERFRRRGQAHDGRE
jgi:isopenicillin N synthase-like dioxygenase